MFAHPRQAYLEYSDVRAKFMQPTDDELSGVLGEAMKVARTSLACASIMRTLRDSSIASDGVKLMSAMKKAQALIRKYKVLPGELPLALKSRYQSGLSMEG